MSALSSGIPEPGPGPAWVTTAAGMSGPTRPRARGAPGQLLPLTPGAWRAPRAPAQLLLPVLVVREGPPRCRRLRARGSPGPLRQRWELPGSGPARRCLVPHGWSGSVPLLLPGQVRTSSRSPGPASPTRGASGASHAAAVAPRCFPRSVLVFVSPSPCPPLHLSRDAAPVPRVPRGFRREDKAVSPLMRSWEAAGTSASPLSPLRVPVGLLRGAAQLRAGDGTKAAARSGSPRPLRALVWRRFRAPRPRLRGFNLPRGQRQPRCRADTTLLGLRQSHGHGNGRGCPSPGRSAGTRASSAARPRGPAGPFTWCPRVRPPPSQERDPASRVHANSRVALRSALINND